MKEHRIAAVAFLVPLAMSELIFALVLFTPTASGVKATAHLQVYGRDVTSENWR